MVFVRANPGRSFRAVRAEAKAERDASLPQMQASLAKKSRLAELQAALARIEKPSQVQGATSRHVRAHEGRDALSFGIADIAFGIRDIDACFAHHGLARGGVHEVMPVSLQDRASGVAFTASLLARAMSESEGPAVLVTSEASRRDFGTPYGPALFRFGVDPSRLILIEAKSDLDAFWAIEEVLRAHAGLAGTLALMGKSVTAVGRNASSAKGTHLADLTLSRRLTLAASETATPLFLEMPGLQSLGSAAMTRWRIAPAYEADLRFGPVRDAIFRRTRWRASLERSRNGRTGEWIIEWDHAAHRFHMAAELAGDALVSGTREKGGPVLPFRARR